VHPATAVIALFQSGSVVVARFHNQKSHRHERRRVTRVWRV
jgi:hypothetical protein